MNNAWLKYDDKSEIFKFNDEYITFLNEVKTEREAIKKTIKLAREAGFKDISEYDKLSYNDKVYVVNRNKAIALYVIGKKELKEGMNILGAHVDSPRLDLKQNPLYEAKDFALFKTHYYGGVKKYQWLAHALAIHGVVCKKDGSVIEIRIGEDENDPVIGISDLLPHLAMDQMQKKASEFVPGESLNITVGSMPLDKEKDAVKRNILAILKNKYDFDEADFMSAELEIVPAGKARHYGLDKSMVLAYGHDDRVCAYTSLRAILEVSDLEKTACCILVDKEEIGSMGSTGMHSRFYENSIAKIMDKLGEYSSLNLMDALSNSKMLSSDVTAAYDPNFTSLYEELNTAFLGKGIAFAKYTGARGKAGCNDAHPEFIAAIRNALDKHNISYQTGELGKVDQGGGGTIAYILANLNIEVIDAGLAVQNMHACYEVVSKVDVFEAYKAYKVFLKEL